MALAGAGLVGRRRPDRRAARRQHLLQAWTRPAGRVSPVVARGLQRPGRPAEGHALLQHHRADRPHRAHLHRLARSRLHRLIHPAAAGSLFSDLSEPAVLRRQSGADRRARERRHGELRPRRKPDRDAGCVDRAAQGGQPCARLAFISREVRACEPARRVHHLRHQRGHHQSHRFLPYPGRPARRRVGAGCPASAGRCRFPRCGPLSRRAHLPVGPGRRRDGHGDHSHGQRAGLDDGPVCARAGARVHGPAQPAVSRSWKPNRLGTRVRSYFTGNNADAARAALYRCG